MLLFLFCLSSFAAPHTAQFVPGQILIRPKASLTETNWDSKIKGRGARHHRTLHRSNIRVISVAEENTDAVIAALRNDPEIEFAERDYIAQTVFIPNDPYVTSGNEWHLGHVQADLAWDLTAGINSTVVAVLDSGISSTHPDLAGKVLPGWDFVNNDSDTWDDFGHGTGVAGTIVAAGNNGRGVAGVAFGCRVLSVKVVDSSGFGAYSCIAQGIRYAVDQGARVINLSIAGNSPSSTLQDAIDYAWSNNVVIVAAAGNNANSSPQYPAACNHVIAVSATDANDRLASFSSYGNFVQLSAPGDNIWTTQRDTNNPYGSWRGTSLASPVVAGVAALMASANSTLANSEIVNLLRQTADDLGTAGYDTSFGFGRVNAFRAVTAASSAPGAPPPTGPGTNGIPPEIANDSTLPAITIIEAPKQGERLSSSTLDLTGTANDNVGVWKIEVRLNGQASLAEGTTNWHAQLNLLPGLNHIAVRSIDLAGNASSETTLTVTYVLMTPLIVQINGSGTVSPNLHGTLLEAGKTYTLKAVPAKGRAFAGWNGSDLETKVLSFVMKPDLVLTADFVSSPFPPARGKYAGLVMNTNGVTPESSGCFTLSVTPSGRFTGKIVVGKNRRGFHGQLNLSGAAAVNIKRGSLNPLALTLHADLTDGTDQVAGYLTDGTWTSGLMGDRNIFSAKLNPAPQAGSRAFVLQQADDAALTAANGSSVIARSGTTRVKGKLQDGRAFSAGNILAKNGDYPFCLSLNRGQEIVIGWLNFPDSLAPSASGTVLWVRSGTNAFTSTLQATSAP